MKKILLGFGLAILSLCAACGSGGGPTQVGKGPFSNASLIGQYAYRLVGVTYDPNTGAPSSYSEAGIFTSDGQGHLTSGLDDSVQGASVIGSPTTGSYSINPDGTGGLTLNFGASGNETLAITLASPSKLYLIEQDFPQNTYGVAELQSPATLGTIPTATFVFRMHDQATSGRIGTLTAVPCNGGACGTCPGQISAGTATITGSEDLLDGTLGAETFDNGTTTPLNLNGTLYSPTSGRSLGCFSDGVSTVSFEYYIVDGNNIRFLRTDSGIIGLGRAEAQTPSLTTASLNGGYAFGSRADDNTSFNGQNTVGQIIFDGAGAVSGGLFDSARDGVVAYTNSPISSGGSYAFTPSYNGRAVVNFTTGPGPVAQIFWLVSPSRAFFLTNDPSKLEDGIADFQQATTFSNSSLSGQYAFVMDGFDTFGANIDRVGWLSADGAGNMNLLEGLNNSTNVNVGFVNSTASGAYSFTDSTSGRATSDVLQNGTNDLVFYVVSGSRAYLLQNDAEIIGAMDLQ